MSIQRDPHLPPPEVCDWLLEQEWSKPAVVHISSPECTGWRDDSCRSTAALGRDGVIELLAFAEDLEMLREDQRQRRETPEQRVERLNKVIDRVAAATGKTVTRKLTVADLDEPVDKADPEVALLERILAEVAQTNLTAFQGIGILQTAATMMISQCYDLTKLGDDHADA